MSSFIDKAREQAGDFLEKAKPYVDKAKEQAEDLVEKAKPLAEKAKEQAGDFVDKARPAAASAAGKISEGLDKATGGRYTEKIDGVSDKVEGALRGSGAKGDAGPADAAEADIADIAVATTDPFAATSTGQSAAAADLIDAEIVEDAGDDAAPAADEDDGPEQTL